MANTAEIRNGLCIEYNNDIYQVVDFQHVKPGKGPAFVRTKLKSMTNGRVVDNTFPAGHKINTVRIERRKFQYLYKDESGFQLMDNETFEQVALSEQMVPFPGLLIEGMEVDVLFNANTESPLTAELPKHVVMEVTYTEPGIKGDTATNASKPATLQTGIEISVPLFINIGDKVKVDTETGQYVERAK